MIGKPFKTADDYMLTLLRLVLGWWGGYGFTGTRIER